MKGKQENENICWKTVNGHTCTSEEHAICYEMHILGVNMLTTTINYYLLMLVPLIILKFKNKI